MVISFNVSDSKILFVNYVTRYFKNKPKRGLAYKTGSLIRKTV